MLHQHILSKKPFKKKPNLSLALKTDGTITVDAHVAKHSSHAHAKPYIKPNEGKTVGHFNTGKRNGIPVASLKTTAFVTKKIRLASQQEKISEYSESTMGHFNCDSSSNWKSSKQKSNRPLQHIKSNTTKWKNTHVESNSDNSNTPPKKAPQPKTIVASKTELPSPNWNAFLKARAQRRKEGNNTFFKKAKSRNPPKILKEQPEIWFDDVDEILLDKPVAIGISNSQHSSKGLVKEKSFGGLTRILAMDCEMVGVGFNGRDSIVARVSIVNVFGQCIYDNYVAPTEKVTDYRTPVSGIRPDDLVQGTPFKHVQKEVSDILKDRILVGHAVHHDLKVLFLDHPRNYTRDTSEYKPFRKLLGGGTPSLKRLSEKLLNVRVQEGEHNSVQDAQAAMRLYTMHKKEWEKSLRFKRKKPQKKKLSKTSC